MSAIILAGSQYEDYAGAMEVARENAEDQKWDAAVKDFTEAAKLAKTPVEQYTARLEASRTLERKGDFPAAVSVLQEIFVLKGISPDQKSFALLFIANNLNQKQKKSAEAAAEYEKVIAMKLKNPAIQSAHHQLAMLYFYEKNYDRALAVANRAIQDDTLPNTFKNTERIIVIKSLIAQKKLEEARTALDAARKMPDLNLDHKVQLNNERGGHRAAESQVRRCDPDSSGNDPAGKIISGLESQCLQPDCGNLFPVQKRSSQSPGVHPAIQCRPRRHLGQKRMADKTNRQSGKIVSCISADAVQTHLGKTVEQFEVKDADLF